MSDSSEPPDPAFALRRLKGIGGSFLLWGFLAGGLWLARPQSGSGPEECWLFVLWSVLLVSLSSQILRTRQDVSADGHVG